MLSDDEDRQFTPADIAELLAVVVALGLLFWLLDSVNPWLRYPAILVGSVAVLACWRAARRRFDDRSGRRERRIEPLRIVETSPGARSLILVAGGTPSDQAVQELGHEPNGYFWQGVAERILPDGMTEVIDFDSESGMFCARSADPDTLLVLGTAMAAVVNDPARLREVVAAAKADGFVFDD
ncbi:Imm51 family immunity protein [Tsukamurella sputi]|uniref:Imm51 family immunity protein n=1 Tax=Tsukamurella sputi TaxID=2591848 RepID=UPI0019602880|nr:Imm51 family immunity protein [Tsukamurella sputi]